MFDAQLKSDVNTDSGPFDWRGHQRIRLLRALTSSGVCKNICSDLYQTFIESRLNFLIYGLSLKDKNPLNSTVTVCSRIIGVQQKDLCSLWEKRERSRGPKAEVASPNSLLCPQVGAITGTQTPSFLRPSGCWMLLVAIVAMAVH